MKTIHGLLALALVACGSPPPPAPIPSVTTATPKREPRTGPMKPFEQGGYTLSGAEYWPYVGTALEPKYPEEVLWGFYPEKGVPAPNETDPNADDASPAAIACAERAYEDLRNFLSSNPQHLRAIVDQGKAAGFTPLFYLWVNDYSRAAEKYPHPVRPARLWYWKRKVPDPKRPPGYWKWESTLTRAGECQTPGSDQVATYLKKTLEDLTKQPVTFPN